MNSTSQHNTVTAYLALGANLGDAQQAVHQAMRDIAQLPDTRLLACSSLYRTAPVESSGPDYINAVVQIETALQPLALLHAIHALEQAAGRERPWRNAPRTLDIDILLYGDLLLNTPELTIPHPRMGQRAFVLVPLAEIAPEKVDARQLQAVANQAIQAIERLQADGAAAAATPITPATAVQPGTQSTAQPTTHPAAQSAAPGSGA